jgi:hypothetical protein
MQTMDAIAFIHLTQTVQNYGFYGSLPFPGRQQTKTTGMVH